MISLRGPPPQELLDRADSKVHSSLYNAQGMYDTVSADVAYDPNVNSHIQSSSPPQLLRFRIAHLSSKERISGSSSNLHLRCFSGFQRSD